MISRRVKSFLSWLLHLESIYGERYRALFQDTKFSLTKRKKSLLEASYETSQTSKLKLFTKNVDSL